MPPGFHAGVSISICYNTLTAVWRIARPIAILGEVFGDATLMQVGETPHQPSRAACPLPGQAVWSLGRMILVVFVICLVTWIAVIAFILQL
jgi:hypothetical protein